MREMCISVVVACLPPLTLDEPIARPNMSNIGASRTPREPIIISPYPQMTINHACITIYITCMDADVQAPFAVTLARCGIWAHSPIRTKLIEGGLLMTLPVLSGFRIQIDGMGSGPDPDYQVLDQNSAHRGSEPRMEGNRGVRFFMEIMPLEKKAIGVWMLWCWVVLVCK